MSGDMPSEHDVDLLIREVRLDADGVVVLTLVDPAGHSVPEWQPGAHVDLVLTADLVRQYSLCGSPEDRSQLQVGVLRAADSRGGSAYIHEHLKAGSTLSVRGPRNHFPLLPSPRYLFIAGGIGITPLLPMIRQAEAAGAQWHLYYGGRSRSSMAFLPELEAYDDRVTVLPDDEPGRAMPLHLESILGSPQAETLVYCCGPEPLLAAAEKACESWPSGVLHLERFTPKTVADAPTVEFTVVLERSGITITVGTDDTIFSAAERAGVSVLGSCREGICGTCETVVLEGEVDHRDSVLSASEQATNESMMICVSRARGPRLVIDL